MDFTNYLELSDAEKFSFDGIPFSGDNLPAKTQTFFIKPLESASFLESTWLMCQLSLKSRSACKLHARTKETVQSQDLKAIKAFWQCIEVHEKTLRNRAGFHEEKGLIDGNTKQAGMVNKDNVRFPGKKENSSWKTGVLFLDKDLCILSKQIMEQCSQKERQGSTWSRRHKPSSQDNLLIKDSKPLLFFPVS